MEKAEIIDKIYKRIKKGTEIYCEIDRTYHIGDGFLICEEGLRHKSQRLEAHPLVSFSEEDWGKLVEYIYIYNIMVNDRKYEKEIEELLLRL